MTPEQRHNCMSHNRSKNTTPEITLRHALWRLGFRYRMNDRRLPGTPDIVLSKYRTAIFIHGCFWHGHKNCRNHRIPKTNTDFWVAKITRNQQRDQETWRQLESLGWSVIVIWECELKKTKLQDTVGIVETEIKAAGERYQRLLYDRRQERDRARKERIRLREERSKLAIICRLTNGPASKN